MVHKYFRSISSSGALESFVPKVCIPVPAMEFFLHISSISWAEDRGSTSFQNDGI
jgi:hypothetical protein